MTRPAKRTTSEDVARAAGVSRTTVSFVLNNRPGQLIPEETRRRVLDAAQRLDYRPHASARALAAGRSDVALLSIPDLPVGPAISRFVEELATALATHGLTLVTHLAGAHGRSLPDVCASVDASAVIGLESFDSDTVQALYRAGANIVIPSDDVNASGAIAHIGRLQAEHLISRGYRKIGYATPEHPSLKQLAEYRLRGIAQACADAEIPPPVVLSMSLEIASATQAATEWAAQSVTGVCAYNDETALAILAGLHQLGRTAPDDLAIIGADDMPAARLAIPPLTTIHLDLRELGRSRAEAVVAGLAGEKSSLTFEPAVLQVIQRSST